MNAAKFNLLSIVSILICIVSSATAQSNITAIVLSGSAAPVSPGVFSAFYSPTINDSGKVAFYAALTGTGGGNNNEGIFIADTNSVIQVVREGQAAPMGSGTFTTFSPGTIVAINGSGQAAFWAKLSGASVGTTNNQGIFLGSGGALTQIARTGMASPDGNGFFASFLDVAGDPPVDVASINATLNDAGQAVFFARLSGTFGATLDDQGIYRSDGASPILIARKGNTAPGVNQAFDTLEKNPQINESGTVAFKARSRDVISSSTKQAIFWSDGINLTRIALEGDNLPDSVSTLSIPSLPAINDSGTVAFSSGISHPTSNPYLEYGIYKSMNNGLIEIAQTYSPAPGSGVIPQLSTYVAFNASGQVAFRSLSWEVDFGGAAGNNAMGIFRGDGNGLIQIARHDQVAPEGNGNFTFGSGISDFWGEPQINNAGQVVFRGRLANTTGGTSDDRGLYFYDNSLGLLKIVRLGDGFLGSSITSLGNPDGIAFANNSDERVAINILGQVAFAFSLADGRKGVALWSPPPVVNTPPSPHISLGFGTTIIFVAWATNSPAVLQSTTNAASSASWQDVGVSPTIVGGEYQVQLPIQSGSRFFRLRN